MSTHTVLSSKNSFVGVSLSRCAVCTYKARQSWGMWHLENILDVIQNEEDWKKLGAKFNSTQSKGFQEHPAMV